MGGLESTSGEPRILGSAGAAGTGGTGPLQRTTKTLTFADSPYTVLTSDYCLLCDCTGGAIQVDLPTAIGNTRELQVKKIDVSANIVTIDAFGAETIEYALTNTDLVLRGQSYTIHADGANYLIFGGF